MKVIVVTGGIGGGKSTACRFLSERFGWPVYSADDRAKQLYVKSPTLLADIETKLCACFRDEDGRFCPASLANVIFTDSEALATVENLLFPELESDFVSWKHEHSEAEYVIFESATILEKPGLKGIGDVTVLIDAPVDARVERAALRDGADAGKVRSRMAAQSMMNAISDGLAESPTDFVVMNGSSEEDFHDKLYDLAEKIIKHFC